MPVQAIPFILSIGLLFGSTLIASRFAVGQFASITYIALRLGMAGMLHAAYYLFGFQGRSWPTGKKLWSRGLVLGIFGTAIPMNFITASLNYQSSGVTSILVTLNPAITVLLAHFFLGDEHLTRRKLVGIGLALSGAVFMIAMGETGLPDVTEANPIGYLLVIGAMISGSSATVFARKHMSDLDAFDVGSVRMWIASLVVIPTSFLLAGFDLSSVNLNGYLALGWATIFGTFLGMLLSFYIIQRFGATASAMTAYVIPVVSSLGGVWLLDEAITWGMAGGILLILIGILVINRQPSKLEEQLTIS